MNLRHTLTLAGAGLAALSAFSTLPAVAQAPAAPTTPPAAAPATTPPTRGQIKTASATSLTITPRGGGADKTFTITPTTTIMVDGKTAAAADLPVGRNASVVSADGTTATSVTVRARRQRGGGAGAPGGMAPAAPTTPATPAPTP